jgi:hypothetical protein
MTTTQSIGAQPGLLGIRDTLNTKYGVGNERIGWDGEHVTIDGKKAIKPLQNVNGTTYADQATFNSAAGTINSLNQQNQLMNKVLNPQQMPNPYDQQVSNMINTLSGRINTPTVNPMDERFNTLLDQLSGRMQNPSSIDRNAVYQSPQYAAQQANVNRQISEQQRQSREGLNRRGIMDSSITASQANQIAQQGTEYLETQAIPQIIAQMQAEEDQKTAGLMNLLNVLGQQQSLYDSRASNQTNDLASLLGVLGQQQGLVDTRANNEFDRAASVLEFLTGRQDRAEDRAYQQGRDAVTDKRYDAEFSYQKEKDALAQKNLEDEKAYRMQQDNEDNRRWWAQYERDGEQFAAQQGLQWAQLNQRDKEFMADQAWKEKTFAAEMNAESKIDMDDERRELAAAIRANEITPAMALSQIDQDVELGFYTESEANQLRSIVSSLAPTTAVPESQQQLTKEQADAMPSDAQLNKLYEKEGKPIGAALIDWKQWYRDPKGRIAGVDYKNWHKLYGPELKAR